MGEDGAGRGSVRLRTVSVEPSAIEPSTHCALGLLLPVHPLRASPAFTGESEASQRPARARTWEAEPLAVETVLYCD